MELESKNGSKIRLQQQTTDFGRGLLGFSSTDRTVSRHHISFKLHEDEDGTKVYFQVKGKNPVWVRDSTTDEIRVYKTSEPGELNIGDSFCVSAKDPVWFNLKRIASEDEDEDDEDGGIRYDEAFSEISGVDHDQIETGDVSDIDPVKEFNFVVLGHEFDCYQKKLIRDMKKWNWFLEEPDKDSDEEDDTGAEKSRKGGRKKRKKGGRGDDDDDVWTGESEEDVELINKSRNGVRPKYSTRSKDKNKKGAGTSKSAKHNAKRKATSDDDDDEEEDEDDETLGGFIVDDEDIGEGNEEDDEEEEFEDDEDDE